MIVSVASGKGGTGKTLVATSLAFALPDHTPVHLLDCDVEGPNAGLLLHPTIVSTEPVLISTPVIAEGKCTRCGLCAEVCAYHAIAVTDHSVMTFPQLCHGCGACSALCPERAITEQGRRVGSIEIGQAGAVRFAAGRLNVGEALAPPVIRAVKAQADGSSTVIVDAPPGTSCPMVEAVRGSDYCLLVTEPTPFGLNDLMIAADVMDILHIPAGVVINRDGEGSEAVEGFAREREMPILLRIPFDRRIAENYCKGSTLVEGLPEWRGPFLGLFQSVADRVGERV